MNKNEFIDSLLRRVKDKRMKEETKQSLSDFFANHPERNEVYLSGEKLFYNRGAAESYAVPVVKYTRQDVEAMQQKPTEEPADNQLNLTDTVDSRPSTVDKKGKEE